MTTKEVLTPHQLMAAKHVKLHKVGHARRDTMRALAAYPAFKDSNFEAWAVRFEHLIEMSKSTEGGLDHERFDRFCKLALGMKAGTSEFLFKVFDKDNSGSISASEFIQSAVVIINGTLEQKLAVAFNAYDTNGDGTCDKDEMYAGMMAAKGLTTDDFNKEVSDHIWGMIKKMDKNNDGKIDKKEFMEAVANDKRIVDELGLWLRTSKVLSEQQIVMLKALFKDVDQDSSGRIGLKEMNGFAKMILPGKPKLAAKRAGNWLRKMDEKGHDGVDIDEWIKYFEHLYAGKSEDAVTNAIIALKAHFKA